MHVEIGQKRYFDNAKDHKCQLWMFKIGYIFFKLMFKLYEHM
jgi:hypothetical protein